jgi:hypothetical protein
MKVLLLFALLISLFAQNSIINIKPITQKETCGVITSHFNNPSPAEWTAGRPEWFTQITTTTEVAGTAKVEGVISYFGHPSTTFPVRLDLKDGSHVTIATTGDFIPSVGWNTIDFTSFTSKGTGKTLTVWITTGSGSGKMTLHSGYIKYLPH